MRSTTHLLSCCLYVALVANLALLPAPSATQPHRHGYVYVEGSYLMLNGERFIAKGYNYLPRDYGWTDMADWTGRRLTASSPSPEPMGQTPFAPG